MARATFAEILVPTDYGSGKHPEVAFGTLHTEPRFFAIGHYERDESGRVRAPKDMIRELRPRTGDQDPWHEPYAGYHIRLHEGFDELPLENVLESMLRSERADLKIKGVHRVENQNGEAVMRLMQHQIRGRKLGDPSYERRFQHLYRPLALHAELEYLKPHADARLVHYPRISSSCEQKLELLQEIASPGEEWSIDRVISAHYFTRKDGDGRFTILLGAQLRELGDGAPAARERLASELAGYPLRYASRSELPKEMESGTCTPFVFASRVPDIEKVVWLRGRPELRALPEEYSIGAHGPEAHSAGLQVAPAVAETILREELRLPIVERQRY